MPGAGREGLLSRAARNAHGRLDRRNAALLDEIAGGARPAPSASSDEADEASQELTSAMRRASWTAARAALSHERAEDAEPGALPGKEPAARPTGRDPRTRERQGSSFRDSEAPAPSAAARRERRRVEDARTRAASSQRGDVQRAARPAAAKAATPSGRSLPGRIAAAAARGAGALLAPVGAAAVSFIVMAALGLLLATLMYAEAEAEKASMLHGLMSDSEQMVADYLLGKGLDEVHVAAIMGNMREESGGELGGEFDFSKVEEGTGAGHGLCQWTGSRWSGAGGLLEFASARGVEWTDPQAQLDFFWSEFSEPWAGAYSIVDSRSSDPPAGTYVYGSKASFEAAAAVDAATEAFCYGWERPGIPRISERVASAEWYYSVLEGDALRQAILERAYFVADTYATPYVFGGNDIVNGCDCSYLTQWVYAEVGISIPRTSEAQLGAAVDAVPISEALPGDILWMPGHVGIYVDADTVVEQTPPCCRENPYSYNGNHPTRQGWTYALRYF